MNFKNEAITIKITATTDSNTFNHLFIFPPGKLLLNDVNCAGYGILWIGSYVWSWEVSYYILFEDNISNLINLVNYIFIKRLKMSKSDH